MKSEISAYFTLTGLDFEPEEITKKLKIRPTKIWRIEAEIVFSAELIDQIRRVGKYLWNKDKAGLVLSLIFTRLNIYYVTPNFECLIPEDFVSKYLR